jgi:hypothetical protein
MYSQHNKKFLKIENKSNPIRIISHSSLHSLPSQPPATTNLLSESTNFAFLTFHVIGTIQYMTFL